MSLMQRGFTRLFAEGQMIELSSPDDYTRPDFENVYVLVDRLTAQPDPRLFSFNNPYGACPTCQGFGNTIGLDINLVIPNPGLSLNEGAIEPWTKPQHEWAAAELRQFCKAEKISLNTPFNQLTRQ